MPAGIRALSISSGPTRTREWILKNKEQELCPDCYRAQLEAKREADHAWQEKNPGGRRIAIWHPKQYQ